MNGSFFETFVINEVEHGSHTISVKVKSKRTDQTLHVTQIVTVVRPTVEVLALLYFFFLVLRRDFYRIR